MARTTRTTRKSNGTFQATAAQIRQAYEAHFDRPMPSDLPFADAGQEIIDSFGNEPAARHFIQGQAISVDPELVISRIVTDANHSAMRQARREGVIHALQIHRAFALTFPGLDIASLNLDDDILASMVATMLGLAEALRFIMGQPTDPIG